MQNLQAAARSTYVDQGELFGHPKGLYILFFTELWERFSFYGMRAILTLFLVSTVNNGGFGFTKLEAFSLYGWYTMAAYLTCIPGGWIADKYIGAKKSVMWGGLLLCTGHCILAIDSVMAFYIGLAFIVLGVGGLKPNISSMVGGLYAQGDARRDAGFTIFYMGINIGAFVSTMLVGYVGETIGWHYGFGLAGIGMVIGQLVFYFGRHHLQGIGEVPTKNTKSNLSVKGIKSENSALTKVEKDRLLLIVISFCIVVIFWGAFEQAGGLLNIYAKEKVNRVLFGYTIPASLFQSLNPFFILSFGLIVSSFWLKFKASSLFKMAVGTIIMGLGFLLMVGSSIEVTQSSDGLSNMFWLVGAYWFHTIGELCLSPVSLSFITKVSPKRYVSIMMGLYFGITGIAQKIAGLLGEYSVHYGEKAIFTVIFAFSVFFGLILLAYRTRINYLSHGSEEDTPVEETEKPFQLEDSVAY